MHFSSIKKVFNRGIDLALSLLEKRDKIFAVTHGQNASQQLNLWQRLSFPDPLDFKKLIL